MCVYVRVFCRTHRGCIINKMNYFRCMDPVQRTIGYPKSYIHIVHDLSKQTKILPPCHFLNVHEYFWYTTTSSDMRMKREFSVVNNQWCVQQISLHKYNKIKGIILSK